MSLLQKTLLLNKIIRVNKISLGKYSISPTDSLDALHFNSNFTQEEQAKVLKILNDSNTKQLSKFHVSQNRIKNIESWKNKKGSFRTLSEVLEVDGLGEKLLHKMCEDIVNENRDTLNSQVIGSEQNLKSKRHKQIVTPPVNGNITNNITSALGIHLSPIGISWAKLSREENKLISWNFESFMELPKKMLPTETFDMVINIVRQVPPSDVYVLETSPSMGPQNQASHLVSHTQQLELSSMLLALLNTSVNHNITLQNNNSPSKSIENRVFYLKPRIYARLFSTLVGQEKVAAITTINELLENNAELKKYSLPCSPIAVEQHLKNTFNIQTPANKELLGQALMLVISFMELCVYKNPVALATLLNVYRRNKKEKNLWFFHFVFPILFIGVVKNSYCSTLGCLF